MTDEDDGSKNETEGHSYEECKDILHILNGEQHQDDAERKSIQDLEIKDEFDVDDEIDLNDDKLNGEDNDELDRDSMLMLNGKRSLFFTSLTPVPFSNSAMANNGSKCEQVVSNLPLL